MRFEERHQFIDAMIQGVKEVPVERIVAKDVDLRPKGNHLMGLCPFHTDRKIGSFVVTPSKGLWKCYSCGEGYGGNGIKFVMQYYGLDFLEACFKIAIDEGIISYDEYLTYSAKNYKKEYVTRLEKKDKETEKEKLKKIMVQKADADVIHKVYLAMKKISGLNAEDKEYLQKVRLLTQSRIEKDYFSMPVRNKAGIVKSIMAETGIKEEELIKVPGFFYDLKYKQVAFMACDGIGILIRDEKKQVIGVQIRKRILKKKESRYIWFSSSFAIYESEKYTGGSSVGSPKDILIPENPKGNLCITEGRFKAEQIYAAGNCALSIQGVSTWKGIEYEIPKIEKVIGKQINNIYMMFDADMFSNISVFENMRRISDILKKQKYTIKVCVWRKGYGKGIDDLMIERNGEKLRYMDFEIVNRTHDKVEKEMLLKYHLSSIKDIKNLSEEEKERFENDMQKNMEDSLKLP